MSRRWAAWPLLLLLGAASCGDPKRAAGLDFAAYGDCRHGTDIHRRIARSISGTGAKFVLVSGDLVDSPDDQADWDTLLDITKDLRRRPYYCALGDHDSDAKKGFEKSLGLDRLYFDHLEGDVHVFVLNSCSKFEDTAQLDWLEKTAAASTAKHKIAVFHHPPFGIHGSRTGQTESLRPLIHPRLVKLKFCAAICGHQHMFYTTARDGVRYVVTAGGGATLYNPDSSLTVEGDRYRKFHHFVGFQFVAGGIDGHVYDPDGVEAESLAFPLCRHP